MQANIAIGLLETTSIAKGVETLDAMCKAAGIKPTPADHFPRGKTSAGGTAVNLRSNIQAYTYC